MQAYRRRWVGKRQNALVFRCIRGICFFSCRLSVPNKKQKYTEICFISIRRMVPRFRVYSIYNLHFRLAFFDEAMLGLLGYCIKSPGFC